MKHQSFAWEKNWPVMLFLGVHPFILEHRSFFKKKKIPTSVELCGKIKQNKTYQPKGLKQEKQQQQLHQPEQLKTLLPKATNKKN